MPKRIIVTLEDDGRVTVDGPLDDGLTCYGLLEVAREILLQHRLGIQRTAVAGRIAVPPRII